MEFKDEGGLRKHLIWRLFKNGKVSSGNTLYEEKLIRGLPKHLIGSVKNELKQLVNEGLICEIPKKQGSKYYLNPNKKEIFMKIINEIIEEGRYRG